MTKVTLEQKMNFRNNEIFDYTLPENNESFHSSTFGILAFEKCRGRVAVVDNTCCNRTNDTHD